MQLEGRLKQLQDDYETLSEQAQFSQSRAEDLQAALERAAEEHRRSVSAGVIRACVTQGCLLQTRARIAHLEDELLEAERRAEGEEFFKLAQEGLKVRAEALCAQREREMEVLVEELEVAQAYAAGVGALLRSSEGGKGNEGVGGEWKAEDVEGFVVGAERMEAEARAGAVDVALVRGLLEEVEKAEGRVEGMEEVVDGMEEDEDRLVEEVCGLRRRVGEMEVRIDATAVDSFLLRFAV